MTRRFTGSRAVGFCISLLLPALAGASTIIFGNLGTSPVYNTAGGNSVGNDFVGDDLAEGDTFTPSATAAFGSLDIALSCNIAACPDSFVVSLDHDSGSDSPGTVIESFVGSGALLGQLGLTNPLIVFNSVLMPSLTLGTQYWVTVSTDLSNSITWNWNVTGDTSDQAISTDSGATWFSPSGLTPGAYQVNSKTTGVPEPASMMLLAPALLLLCLMRRGTSRRA